MRMGGETNLANLLKGMRPVLEPGSVVFATLNPAEMPDWSKLLPLGTFHEREGLTLILSQQAALDAGLAHSSPLRQITLTIHSSLEAVGLTAAISTALTEAGISANVIAAFYHDHVFVPAGDAELALAVLEGLAAR